MTNDKLNSMSLLAKFELLQARHPAELLGSMIQDLALLVSAGFARLFCGFSYRMNFVFLLLETNRKLK